MDDVIKSLKDMVDMMDSGDEHGKGSEWHKEAVRAITNQKVDKSIKQINNDMQQMLIHLLSIFNSEYGCVNILDVINIETLLKEAEGLS